jgi:hypothetical protein
MEDFVADEGIEGQAKGYGLGLTLRVQNGNRETS